LNPKRNEKEKRKKISCPVKIYLKNYLKIFKTYQYPTRPRAPAHTIQRANGG
jgi:hypothetical protein